MLFMQDWLESKVKVERSMLIKNDEDKKMGNKLVINYYTNSKVYSSKV